MTATPMLYGSSKGSNKPAHPGSLVRAFAALTHRSVRAFTSLTHKTVIDDGSD